ncbi:MAG: DUF4277 domain-containing protein [Symploca sp. SIO2B6]|nr:DUF4277 domain-containing protein [Symploca sp. SIO2B6]
MTWANEIQVKTLNHLGIIAGIIDEIGIVEIINDLVGMEPNLETIISQTKNPTQEVIEVPIKITPGYSRDHRPDWKQFILDLIVS